MIPYNFHQHTHYSDGSGTPGDYAREAIRQKMVAIGFSEHSPLPFDNASSIRQENIDSYITDTEQVKKEYKGRLNVFRALEMDFIPGMSDNFDYWRQRCKADYLIGSIHLVKPEHGDELWFTDGPDYHIYDQGVQDYFGRDIRKAVRQFFHQTNQMITSQSFEIIGHFDKIRMHNRNRFFTDEDKWYRELIDETVSLIKEKGLVVEVNTRGKYKGRCDEFFPDGYALEKVRENNLQVTVSSDAHQPGEICKLFSDAETRLREMGFPALTVLTDKGWTGISL